MNRRIDKSKNSRRGSALLVVLGMLAFMLFSGLAFSVYMRQSRLPTSFLRRTVATRQLAKAALAEAIEQIDTALGNDPHPGVLSVSASRTFSEDELYNIWDHRIFFGAGVEGTSPNTSVPSFTIGSKTVIPDYADADETVPTLTLEGLAYLPPNLINEARYYSQRTPTAKWHSFWFDSGRYAYTAIDVSDYFDVNRVYACKPRTSDNRISFAHLFEELKINKAEGCSEHIGSGKSAASAWDLFMKGYRVEDGNMPLISLADLNVAWGSQNIGSIFHCPFYDLINNGQAYDCGDEKSDSGSWLEENAIRYSMMTFVTDGWYPKPQNGKTADGETIYDLTDHQPFQTDETDLMGTKIYTIDQIASFPVPTYLENRLNILSRVALWDYLDQNKVPTSLAIPTCEQVPMICAIQPQVTDLKLTFTPQYDESKDQPIDEPYADPSGAEGVKLQDYTREVTYQIDLDGISAAAISAQVAWAYPFLLKGQKAQTAVNTSASDDSFSVDGRLALFLTDADAGDMSARPGMENNNSALHIQDKKSIANSEILNNAIITFPLNFTEAKAVEPQNIYIDSSKEGAAHRRIPVKGISAEIRQGNFGATKRGMVKVTYRWPKMKIVDGAASVNQKDPSLDSSDAITSDPVAATGNDTFALLKKDGMAVTDFKFLKDGGKKNVKLNLAVWLRVTDADDKTVDLVPACLMDDSNLNNINNEGMANKLGDTDPYPLLRLDVGSSVELTLAKFASGEFGSFELKDKQLVTGDPRYNHAPEDWQILTSSTMEKDALAQFWYDREYADARGKDGDIYMATSDQASMQSVYELAFLPRIQDGITTGGMNDGFIGDYAKPEDGGQIRASNETLLHRGVMWKTFSPFRRYGTDDFEELDKGRIVSGDTGMKVNPYSDSKEVLMAAFANTPFDWRMASENNPEVVKYENDAAGFNEKYAWNAYTAKPTGGDGKPYGTICWDGLQEFGELFHEKITQHGDWHDALRDPYDPTDANAGTRGFVWSVNTRQLAWTKETTDSSSKELYIDLEDTETPPDSDLFSVDKKFLYGFWHDSFAARQQLFLIFVRAEPMMMGGGVSGQVPPQLGARAVALVWRDPTKTSPRESDSTLANPHRTRILFYHQFD